MLSKWWFPRWHEPRVERWSPLGALPLPQKKKGRKGRARRPQASLPVKLWSELLVIQQAADPLYLQIQLSFQQQKPLPQMRLG